MPKFANVILTIPTEEGFTYRIPSELAEVIQPGMQVSVPFSRRFVSGIVITISDKPPARLKTTEIKEIRDLLDPEPLVSRELMELLKWISDYYVCYLGEAFRLIQSQLNVGKSSLQLTRLIETLPPKVPKEQSEMLSTIPFNRTISFKTIQKKFKKKNIYTFINQWEKKGWVRKEFSALKKKQIFLSREYYKREGNDAELSDAQRKYIVGIEKRQSKSWLAYQYLNKGEWTLKTDLNAAGFTTTMLENLVRRGLLVKRIEKIERKVTSGYQEKIEDNVLTAEQKEIIQNILPTLNKSEFRTFLLHGITGSGKTQIYIEIIKKVLEKNRTAIVLIPEIILTPQTLARFQFYFNDKVGVLHSRLSAGEKREILYKIKNGEYPVVLGARSAIFA
ncbi:MAG: DEAD/DEAH box helicase family protein, partial [bacterium]